MCSVCSMRYACDSCVQIIEQHKHGLHLTSNPKPLPPAPLYELAAATHHSRWSEACHLLTAQVVLFHTEKGWPSISLCVFEMVFGLGRSFSNFFVALVRGLGEQTCGGVFETGEKRLT